MSYETKAQRGKEPIDIKVRTKDYANRIIKLYGALPSGRVADVLGHQLLRSGTSVGANYREAFRSRSKAEFVAKIGDVLKELDESNFWLELMADNNVVPSAKLSALIQETNELTAIFTTVVKKTKATLA